MVIGASKHTPLLAYVCNSSRVYFWSPERGPYMSDLPSQHAQLAVLSLTWSTDGSKLLLQGRESLCLLTLSLEEGMSRQPLSDLSSASSRLAGGGTGSVTSTFAGMSVF